MVRSSGYVFYSGNYAFPWSLAIFDNNDPQNTNEIVYLAGSFRPGSGVTFGTVNLTQLVSDEQDCFIIKFDSNGEPLDGWQINGFCQPNKLIVSSPPLYSSPPYSMSHVLTFNGEFYVGTLSIGPFNLTNPVGSGTFYAFITLLLPNGTFAWALQSTGSMGDFATCPDGTSYVLGGFYSALTFGSFSFPYGERFNNIGVDVWAAKIDVTGNIIQTIVLPTGYSVIGCNRTGIAYIGGTYSAAFSIGYGNDLLPAVSTTDAFWMRTDDIPPCSRTPCFHNGGCTDHLGFADCSCAFPWNGTRCETDISCLCGSQLATLLGTVRHLGF